MSDWVAIGLLSFFILVASTLQFYWITHMDSIAARAEAGDLFAKGFELYGKSDRNYFSPIPYFARGLETIHVCFTQFLYVLLIWAILRRATFRHALQLTVCSYVTYSVVLYHWEGHLSGYATMSEKTVGMFLLLYGSNAPWLLGNAYLAAVSYRAVARRFREPAPQGNSLT